MKAFRIRKIAQYFQHMRFGYLKVKVEQSLLKQLKTDLKLYAYILGFPALQIMLMENKTH